MQACAPGLAMFLAPFCWCSVLVAAGQRGPTRPSKAAQPVRSVRPRTSDPGPGGTSPPTLHRQAGGSGTGTPARRRDSDQQSRQLPSQISATSLADGRTHPVITATTVRMILRWFGLNGNTAGRRDRQFGDGWWSANPPPRERGRCRRGAASRNRHRTGAQYPICGRRSAEPPI